MRTACINSRALVLADTSLSMGMEDETPSPAPRASTGRSRWPALWPPKARTLAG